MYLIFQIYTFFLSQCESKSVVRVKNNNNSQENPDMTNTANLKKIWNMRYLKKMWSIVFRPNTCTINILYIYIFHTSQKSLTQE